MSSADLTVDDVIVAARDGVIALAQDPAMRHYGPNTIALVYQRTVANVAGAGSVEAIAERVEADPLLKDVPVEVLEVLVAASYTHFVRALAARREVTRG